MKLKNFWRILEETPEHVKEAVRQMMAELEADAAKGAPMAGK